MSILVTAPYSACNFLGVEVHNCQITSNSFAVRIYFDIKSLYSNVNILLHESKRMQKRIYIDYFSQLDKNVDLLIIIHSFYGFYNNNDVLIDCSYNLKSKIEKFFTKLHIKFGFINDDGKVAMFAKNNAINYIDIYFNTRLNKRMRKFIDERIALFVVDLFTKRFK